MRTKITLFYALFCGSVFATNHFPTGARFSGMSNTSVMLSDIWSVGHNQAGLASLTVIQFAFHHENRFLLKEYGLSSAVIAVNTRPGTLALQYSNFGYSKYHESKTGLAYARSFSDKVAVGIQLGYFNKFIQNEIEQGKAVTIEGGILFRPLDNLSCGFHVFNPNRSKINNDENERIPSIVKFGVGYSFGKKFMLMTETEKNSDSRPYFKMAMEYSPNKLFSFRAGISDNPQYLYAFGISLMIKKIRMDVASSYHQVLGTTPYFSMLIAL